MRVLHVAQSGRLHADSPIVSLIGLLAAATRRGNSADLLTESPMSVAERSHFPAGAKLRESGDVNLAGCDFVHIHGWGYPLAIQAASLARRAGTPYAVSPGGAIRSREREDRPFGRRFALWRSRKLVRGANFVGAVNQFEKRLLDSAGIHDRVRVLPYGLCFEEYASPRALGSRSKRTLLVMGDVGPQSGCVPLLKSLAEIGPDANDWNVVLAGQCSPDWRTALEAAVRRKSAEDRVSWAFAESPTEQRRLLSVADLFVSPAMAVRPPICVLQAIAGATPAVVTQEGAPDGVETHASGRQAFREAVHLALRKPDAQRQREAADVLQRASNELDWSLLANEYGKLYEGG